jgi:hypothetical protein
MKLAAGSDSPDAALAREALQRSVVSQMFGQMFGPPPGAYELAGILVSYFQYQLGLTEDQARSEVDAALTAARARHRDFDQYRAGMTFLASTLIPEFRAAVCRLTLPEYLGILFAGAKHADLGFGNGGIQ